MKKKVKLLDQGAAELLIADLLSHRSVADVINDPARRPLLVEQDAEPANLLTPEAFASQRAAVTELKAALMRALHCKDIHKSHVQFEVGKELIIQVDGKLMPTIESVYEYMRKRITGEDDA